jgi:hypothetical protein
MLVTPRPLLTNSMRGGIPRIDPLHPLAVGLTSCMVTIAPGIVMDVLRVRHPSTGGAQFGGARGAAATGWSITAAETADLNWSSGEFSVGVFFNQTNTASANRGLISRLAYTNEGTNAGWRLLGRSTDDQWYFEVFANTAFATYGALHGGSCRRAGDQTVMGTSTGSVRNIYQNGVFLASTGTGAMSGSGSAPVNGPDTGVPSYLTCTWNRCLSISDAQWWHSEPVGFLIYPEDDMFAQIVGVVAVGGGFQAAWARGSNVVLMPGLAA